MTHLTTHNLLLIPLIWIALVFLCPSSNLWMYTPEQDMGISSFIEVVFIMLCFCYKSLTNKNYKQAIHLSFIGALNWAVAYFEAHFCNVDVWLISFFHPISFSLAAILLIEKRFKLAFWGYIIGYCLSSLPLMGSLMPILFLQLWIPSLSVSGADTKWSRFISRVFIYSILSFSIYMLQFSLNNSFDNQETVRSIILITAIYFLLNTYLTSYYSHYGDKKLKFISYIPILWIIPLFEIIVKGNKTT